MPLDIRLYSRRACHLCEEMKAVLMPLAVAFGATVQEIDIDTDPALVAQFGTEVPVLFINERKAFKYRVTARKLRDKLQRARREM